MSKHARRGPRLQQTLDLLDRFLAHCRWHLQPEEWLVIEERLKGTPLKEGYSVAEAWTHKQQCVYHWGRLPPEEQRTVLYELCLSLEETP